MTEQPRPLPELLAEHRDEVDAAKASEMWQADWLIHPEVMEAYIAVAEAAIPSSKGKPRWETQMTLAAAHSRLTEVLTRKFGKEQS